MTDWNQRSTFPFVCGRYGRVRRAPTPRSAHGAFHTPETCWLPLSVSARCTGLPSRRKSASIRRRNPEAVSPHSSESSSTCAARGVSSMAAWITVHPAPRDRDRRSPVTQCPGPPMMRPSFCVSMWTRSPGPARTHRPAVSPTRPRAAAVRARAWSIWRAGDSVASDRLPGGCGVSTEHRTGRRLHPVPLSPCQQCRGRRRLAVSINSPRARIGWCSSG